MQTLMVLSFQQLEIFDAEKIAAGYGFVKSKDKNNLICPLLESSASCRFKVRLLQEWSLIAGAAPPAR
ncbi:MAG: hypothetical protein NDI77_17805, partial [Geobacteraceae bacterium]|nr:hypothetical protein [Geobacteraceae bacterium]